MLGIEAECRRLETVAVIGLNAPEPLVWFVAPDRQNAQRFPNLSTNSGSFEFPFDVTV